MIKYVVFISLIYCGILVFFAWLTRSKKKDSDGYLMGGSNLGSLLGFFTFSATLFSTFTILGMPDFFRVHGIGAWIFLAVSDTAMVFMIIWLGTQFRKKASEYKYYGMSGFIQRAYGFKAAGYIAFFGAFIFLIPYVAIQIRGVSIFMNAAFPDFIPIWGWALGMVSIILIYSETGGLKAIIYNDVFQGIVLLITIWIIGFICLSRVGNLETLFTKVAEVDPALLSVPGPKGLFDWQFILGSIIAISFIPFTQPQVSTRLIIMKSQRSLYRMATAIGFFAIVIIFPTMLIGMYGAISTSGASTSEFLSEILINQQSPLTGSIIMIGLLAAAISTSDSQIFALGSELRSLLNIPDKKALTFARFGIVVFAIISLLFSLVSGDELVLLARTSFAGTAIMGPMILIAIFNSQSTRLKWIPWLTLLGLGYFIATQFGLFPRHLFQLNVELVTIGALAIVSAIAGLIKN